MADAAAPETTETDAAAETDEAAAAAALAAEGDAGADAGAEPGQGEAGEEAAEGEPEAKPAEAKSPPWRAYERKKQALARERNEVRAAAAQLEAAKVEFRARDVAFQNELKAGRAAAEQLAQLRAAAKDDPAQVLEALGVDLDTFASGIAKGPEHKQSRELAKLQAQLDNVTKLLTEKEQREKTQAQQLELAQKRETANAEFLGLALSDRYPALKARFSSPEDRDDLIEMAEARAEVLIRAGQKPGIDFTFATVAAALEKRFATRGAPSAGVAAAGASPSTTTARGTVPSKSAKPADAKAPPKTTTNGHAAQSTGAKRKMSAADYEAAAMKLLT